MKFLLDLKHLMKHEKHVQKRIARTADPVASSARPAAAETYTSYKTPVVTEIPVASTAAAASKPIAGTVVRPATCSYPTSSQFQYVTYFFTI